MKRILLSSTLALAFTATAAFCQQSTPQQPAPDATAQQPAGSAWPPPSCLRCAQGRTAYGQAAQSDGRSNREARAHPGHPATEDGLAPLRHQPHSRPAPRTVPGHPQRHADTVRNSAYTRPNATASIHASFAWPSTSSNLVSSLIPRLPLLQPNFPAFYLSCRRSRLPDGFASFSVPISTPISS